MQIYYNTNIPQKIKVEQKIPLGEEISHHLIVVLRHKIGDKVKLCDGKGTLYEIEILNTNKKMCEGIIKKINKQFGAEQKTKEIVVGIAMLKNTERMEWAIEKMVEIGVGKIIPIITQRTERKKINIQRLQKIAQSAAQQSLKGFLPIVEKITTLEKFVNENKTGYIAHCNDGQKIKIPQNNTKYTLLIGPEGDFSTEEIKIAKNNGYQEITLGNARLRAETAAVCAAYQCVI